MTGTPRGVVVPRGHRPFTAGTVLAFEMKRRNMRLHHLAAALRLSDRQVTRYLKREMPIPMRLVGAMCDRMDMEPDELMDDHGYLLRYPTT